MKKILECDSEQGIALGITSLARFNKLIEDRRLAKKPLKTWLVLGRYMLESNGGLSHFGSISAVDAFPDIPLVLPEKKFSQYFWDGNGSFDSKKKLSLSRTGTSVPEADFRCPVCEKGWGISNIHDWEVRSESVDLNLSSYHGKTLKEAQELWIKEQGKGLLFLPADSRFSLKDPNLSSLVKSDEVRKVIVLTYRHKACYEKYLFDWYSSHFKEILKKAGFNGYMSLEKVESIYRTPWFLIKVDGLEITIGYRHQVIDVTVKGRKTGSKHLDTPEQVSQFLTPFVFKSES